MEYWKPQELVVIHSDEIAPSFHEVVAEFFAAQSQTIIEAAQTPVGIVVTLAGVALVVGSLIKNTTPQIENIPGGGGYEMGR